MLWLARLGLRTSVGTVRAGHGYADPSFRPSSLPFVSLIGPLGIEVEPERDLPVASDVLIQLPGFLRGAPRAGEAIVAGSTLSLVLDRDAAVVLSLDGGTLNTAATAQAVCADIEAKLRTAASAGTFQNVAGGGVTDPARQAELGASVCRWDEATSSVVLSSGRQGYVSQLAPSSVDVTGGSAAAALGFTVPAQGELGRHVRQRAPAPKAFAVDLRFDLWTGNQRDLGYLIDALIRVIPTRTRVVTRPALLAAEVGPGDTSLRLLEAGEPTTPESLVHLESSDGFLDRVSDSALELASTASAEAAPPRLVFAGAGVARKVLARTPVVPDPRRSDALAPQGIALTLGLRLVDALPGHAGELAALESDGASLLDVRYAVASVPIDGEDVLVADVTVRARFSSGAGTADASVTRRILLERLVAGASLHVVARAGVGTVNIALDGLAQALDDPTITPTPAVAVPGSMAIGTDLAFRLGNPGGNPAPFELDHVHLHGQPVLALDPRLRTSVNGAAQYRAGDFLTLGASERGLMPAGPTESVYVRAVAGDTLTLDRPIAQRWRRRTLVHGRDCFVQQLEVKRRDDLMNRLYRYSVGYRVSAFLEQPDTAIRGGLVVQPVVEVQPRRGLRLAAGAPGVRAVSHPTEE